MKVRFHFKKTGEYHTYECDMDAIPRIGETVFLHPLRYVEAVPREVIRVHWFAKPDGDEQVDVKIEVS